MGRVTPLRRGFNASQMPLRAAQTQSEMSEYLDAPLTACLQMQIRAKKKK